MKPIFAFCAICLMLTLNSCSKDDSSLYGTLKIRYENNRTWLPETLYLYSLDNTGFVLKEIKTQNLKAVTEHLLVGNYVLEKDSERLAFQILPDRTTTIYYSDAYFKVE
ncbi:MAG: hypothetical protein LUF87_11410 [Alistipes sp.]|nr:hypothetical protein [Alistipes sp.]